MSRRRLGFGIGTFALDKIVVAVVQLAMVPVLANAWGLTQFGIWSMVMTIPSFLVLGDFGIVNSAAARMIRYISREEWDEARVVLHTAWLVTCSIVLAVAALAALILWLMPDGIVPTTAGFGEQEARLTVLVLLVYGLVTIIFRLNTAAWRSAMFYPQSMMAATGTYLAENATMIVLAAIGFSPLVAAFALLGMRLAGIVALYLTGLRLLPRLQPGISLASMEEWREMWGPALSASALGFGLAIYLQGTVMILGSIAGAAVVPAFTAVRTLSRLGVQVASLVALPVSQEFGNAMGRDETWRAGRFFGLVLVPSLLLSAGAGFALALLGGPFVRLWTHGAIVAEPGLLVFMAVSSFAAMLWTPLSFLVLAVNRQKAFSWVNLAVSFVGLVQLALMAKSHGNTAVGLSFALVDMVTLGAIVLFIARHWLTLPEFRSGALATLRELSRPLAVVRSLRQR